MSSQLPSFPLAALVLPVVPPRTRLPARGHGGIPQCCCGSHHWHPKPLGTGQGTKHGDGAWRHGLPGM